MAYTNSRTIGKGVLQKFKSTKGIVRLQNYYSPIRKKTGLNYYDNLQGNSQKVTSGLTFELDAFYTDSYPGSGTTWYDLSGNGYNATLTSCGTDVDPQAGRTITLNGQQSGSRIVTPIGPCSYSNPTFTLEVWFKLTSSQLGIGGVAPPTPSGSRFYTRSFGFEHGLYLTPYTVNGATQYLPYGGYIGRYGGGGSGTQTWDVYPAAMINLNNWICYTAQHQSGTQKHFFNGTLVKTTNWSYTTFSTGTNQCYGIGSGYYGGHFGPARISIMRYYNRFLTESEVKANYQSSARRFANMPYAPAP